MRWIAGVALCLLVSARARADWGPHRDPFDPMVVQRYKAILAHDPYDAHALHQLVAMYQQYRTVAKLEAEYRAQLAKGDDWATLVVLAELDRRAPGEALALWKRALAVKPDDALGWLAAGDAESSDARAARDDYRHAAALAHSPAQQRTALTRLVRAAQVAGDLATVDQAYAELIALAPTDGTLRLERGEAQLAAKHVEAARASFVEAEARLRTDPERRLTAMMDEGIALEALGRPDDAIAQYEHTLGQVPSGYYLGQELVARMVDVDRRRHRLAAAIARLETRWPERARGYFEWATLGDLYQEAHDSRRAIDAYRRALARAPTEIATQRKLIKLLDQVDPAAALAQHEAAAKLAPGDADLQIALAKRYYPAQRAKAFATLDALSQRMRDNVSVHEAIADLYEQWNVPDRAIVQYEAIAAVEPQVPEHLVVLGEAYWSLDKKKQAQAAWQRLEKIGTADALFRYGEVLSMHDAWKDAVTAYTKSIALDGARAAALYGRGRAYDALSKYPEATADARRAVALEGGAGYEDGLRYRQLLVRVLGHASSRGDRGLVTDVAMWRFAFDRGDASAGYLLAAHHARIESDQRHDVLVKLYRLVPTDDSLGVALASSYVHRGEYARARQALEHIAQRNPARAKDMNKLIAQLDGDRARRERTIRWEEEGPSHLSVPGDSPDLVGRNHRLGMRLELGTDVRDASGALVGVGVYRTYHVARGTALVVRLDWQKRVDPMGPVNAVAAGGGITTRLLDARKLELAAGIAPRFEIRYGYGKAPRDRAGINGDVTLEALPRAIPAVVGLRFDQALTGAAKGSALLVELGFEWR